MKNAKLVQLLAMVIASSTMGAKGLACIGDCQDRSDHHVIPLLPESAGDDGGVAPTSSKDELCARYCSDADSCQTKSIAQADGTAISVLECDRHFVCGAGRRPARFDEFVAKEPSIEAAWFAQAAHLEAASIDAFRLLRRDLRALRAPRSLLRQVSRAKREEKRHARRMYAHAKRFGVAVHSPTTMPTPIPSLEEMTRQNAMEGCVRETFGALMAQYQAMHAQNREFATAMQRIAAEEASHAALAHRIDAWARRRLGPEARARIDEARRSAIVELLGEIAKIVDGGGQSSLGLPNACTSVMLAKTLLKTLRVWQDAPLLRGSFAG